MKRMLWYMLILAVALAFPQRRLDVAELLPVELVSVRKENDALFVETDTGDVGRGKNLKSAFKNLEETTAGVIYLDTAEYLLVETETMGYLEELKGYLKPKTRVCVCDQKVDLEQVPEYLAVHKSRVNLKESAGNREIPRLVEEKGKLMLERA